jgi:hypothetical protein
VILSLSGSTKCKEPELSTVSDTSVNEFIGVQAHPWNCVNNWKRLSDQMQATRVPCASDTVEFPAGNSYSWVALNTDIKVAGLTWQGKSVQSLSEIPNADSYFIKGSSSVKITVNAACATSPSDCPCVSNNCSFYPTSPPPTPTTGVVPPSTKVVTPSTRTKVPVAVVQSDSQAVWPIIVGVLIGVVGLLILVIAGMFLLRSRRSRSVPYQETRSPNAHYSCNADSSSENSTVHLSFENPMYADAKKEIESDLYDSHIDKGLFEVGSTEKIYQDFDEDGLPI